MSNSKTVFLLGVIMSLSRDAIASNLTESEQPFLTSAREEAVEQEAVQLGAEDRYPNAIHFWNGGNGQKRTWK